MAGVERCEMIYGIGCDIAKVSRFERWVNNPDLIERFFHAEERCSGTCGVTHACEHYAVRFAAKEAFAKALGTGLSGFALNEVWVVHTEEGRPEFKFSARVTDLLHERAGKSTRVSLSMSHEKEYAVAYAIIEAFS